MDLQFDTAVPRDGAVVAAADAVVCHSCRRTLPTEYYDVSGHVTCAECRGTVETLLAPPAGAVPLLTAGLFGAGAGIAGAIIYYAVIAITNFEIGIVAILIGYMVGYAVRKGAGGGGRRFQILAVALTYFAVSLAYTPIVVKSAIEHKRAEAATTATVARPPARPSMSLVTALAMAVGLMAALPVMVVVGGLPTSLISGLIIFFGMKQAWRMTALPRLEITGPYQVGGSPPAVPQ